MGTKNHEINNINLNFYNEKSDIKDIEQMLLEDILDTYEHLMETKWENIPEDKKQQMGSVAIFASNTMWALWTLDKMYESAWNEYMKRSPEGNRLPSYPNVLRIKAKYVEMQEKYKEYRMELRKWNL